MARMTSTTGDGTTGDKAHFKVDYLLKHGKQDTKAHSKMTLTTKEKTIIKEFKKQAIDRYPDEILNIVIFGSHARGDANSESDIDIMVVTSSDDWKMGDEIRKIGYLLDEEINYKLSIQVISKAHFDYLKSHNYQFINNVEKEGITV